MSTIPFGEFSRHHAPAQNDTRTRIAGGLLTGGLYAVLVLVALLPLKHATLPAEIEEITAILLRDTPAKRAPEPMLSFRKPRADTPTPPVITIAPQAPPQLSASMTETSPLLGGISGSGTMGQGASGAGGNGSGSGGCLDAVWMRAVTERVRQFFIYPPAALAVRRTGLVMVHFAVRRDGQIEKLQISKSSGDAGLDKAALDIVQKAQPLPPIPDRMHTNRVEGELPINFGVRSFNGSSSAGTCG